VSTGGYESQLRWYPRAWRARYGDELVALMEDTYGGNTAPLRRRLGVVRAGLSEHLHALGVGGGELDPGERVRSGSLLVLCAWALFVVAGSGFAKLTEHWDVVTPRSDRWLPAGAYDTVQWAAGIGVVIVLVAAVATLPPAVRFLRDGGWAQVRRPVGLAVGASAAAAVLSTALFVWSHHIGSRQRNGGSWPYAAVGIVWALMVVVALAACTGGAVAVCRRLRLSPLVLRLEGLLAMLLTLAMVAVIGGTLVWWGAIATDAPGFLSASGAGLFGSPGPLTLVVAGLLMLVGLLVAISGASRVARSFPAVSRTG